MSVSISVTRPPLLLRQHHRTMSTENLLSELEIPDGPSDLQPNIIEQIEKIIPQSSTTDNFNSYILSQYIQLLYITIFVSSDTSQVFRDVLDGVETSIKEAWRNRQITDRMLNTLVKRFIIDKEPEPGQELADVLRSVFDRLRPDESYPGSKDIFNIVYAIYNNRPVVAKPVIPYRITLDEVEGYVKPTFVLTSTNKVVYIDTTLLTDFKIPIWKFIYSLGIPTRLEANEDFYFYMYLLASLALPMDPIQLTSTMRANLYTNDRAGVPFINYLAMYLRHSMFGLDYTLSRLADPRRRLTQQSHLFCGVGAATIKDRLFVKQLLTEIEKKLEQADSIIMTEDERVIFNNLVSIVDSKKNSFVREISYQASYEESSVEAIKSITDPEPNPTEDKVDKKVGKKSSTGKTKESTNKESDNGAFSDDKNKIPNDTEIPDDTSTDTTQTGDDTIGLSDQEPSTTTITKLLPLALPTETIDDHIYRLTVLRYISLLCNTPNPDITPDAFNIMKAWCGSLLFIASVETTRKLIAQLKLTGKLKEFVK